MNAFQLDSYWGGCHYDYLELSDDSGDSSGRLCGTEPSGYVHVFGSHLTVTFHTNDAEKRSGFSMHYEAIVGK